MKAPVSTRRAACKCPRQERATVRIKARDTVIEVVVDEQALVEEALVEVDLIHTINLNVLVGMMDLIFSTNKGD